MGGTLELRPVGTVEALAFEGDLYTVRSPRPLPPGTRVTLVEAGTSRALAGGKVVSVDAPDTETGACELKVRLFAPERSARERLVELAS